MTRFTLLFIALPSLLFVSMTSCSSSEKSTAKVADTPSNSEKRHLIYSEKKNEVSNGKLEVFAIGNPKLICGRNILEAKIKGVDSGTLVFTTSGASATLIAGSSQRYIDITCPTDRCMLMLSAKDKTGKYYSITSIDLLPMLNQKD